MTSTKINQNNSHLLVVDDDATQLNILTDILSDEGFDVVTAATAMQAIDCFKKICFSVVVIDLRLPDLNGADLLTRLLKLDPRIRVIIYTGYGSFESAKQAVNSRAFAYMEKANDPASFISTIHRAYQDYKKNYIRDLEYTVSRKNKQLEGSEERLQLALESANGAAWDWNILNGNISFSRNWYKMTGYDFDETLPNLQTWRDRVHPDDVQLSSQILEQYLTGQSDTYESEYRMRTHGNSYLWCLNRGKVIERDVENHPLRMIGIITDVTVRIQHEDALRLAAIAFESHEGISITDAKGHIIRVNQAYTQITGYYFDDIIGSANSTLFPMQEKDVLAQQEMKTALSERGNWQGQRWHKRKNGQDYLVWMNISVVKDAFKKTSHYITHFRDITESNRLQQQISRNADEERVLAAILQFSFLSKEDFLQKSAEIIVSLSWLKFKSKSGIFLHNAEDEDGILTLACSHNLAPELLTLCAKVPFGKCLCGRAAQTAEINYSSCVDSLHETTYSGMEPHGHYNVPIMDGDKVLAVLVLYLEHGHQQQDYELSFLKRVANVLSLGISRHQAEQEVEYLAYHDSLTALPNRLLLMDRLKQTLAINKRQHGFSVLMFIDLDRFKNINDSLGHSVGDALLQEIATRFKQVLREGDTIARFGGDEFVILLTDISASREAAVKEARIISDKLHAASAEEIRVLEHNLFVTLSIGIIVVTGHEKSTETIMMQADTAMYQAKTNGRNRTQFFMPEMQKLARERVELEKDLRYALERQEIQVYYQPQINVQGELVGAEALIRWQHPQRGFISPVEFIPIAEESGAIIELGRYVLEDACQKIKLWQEIETLEHIAVNVSPIQFRQADFVSEVQQSLKKTKVDAKKLTLELTEGLLVEHVEDVIVKMTELKQLGIHFSIDDFGTGYSSLAYLTRFPVDQLKIDKSFVDDIGKDEDDQIIIETIIAMADRLRFNLIAEGVETREQIDFLTAEGCVNFQGYYFSKPLTDKDFSDKYLSEYKKTRCS